MPDRPTPATVYRCYDKDERLLYVGMTSGRMRRFFRHSSDKEWWREIVRLELAHFETVEQAKEAETEAIIKESPKHNTLHNRHGLRPQSNIAVLYWQCRKCGVNFKVPRVVRTPRRLCDECWESHHAEREAAGKRARRYA
jgi:predicted GIY-YIG superfamily endonuclease